MRTHCIPVWQMKTVWQHIEAVPGCQKKKGVGRKRFDLRSNAAEKATPHP
jgi:hypothetical protein